MENEIKAKVFAQYAGQKLISEHPNYNEEYINATVYGASAKGVFMDSLIGADRIPFNSNPQLILKPLSAITTFQLLEICKLYEPTAFNAVFSPDGSLSYDFVMKSGVNASGTINIHESRKAYQWMVENGFDTKQILLAGKTLQESGLAIYK